MCFLVVMIIKWECIFHSLRTLGVPCTVPEQKIPPEYHLWSLQKSSEVDIV